MAPIWSKLFDTTWLFSVDSETLFSQNLNHFILLEPMIRYKWVENGPDIGPEIVLMVQSYIHGTFLFVMHDFSAII